MEQIEELLQTRIEGIHDPVQKIMLQDVLVDVFKELLHYSEEQLSALEAKVDAELPDPSGKYYIYTGVCKKEGLDDTSRCLFEVNTGEDKGAGYLGTIFLTCDYPTIRGCLKKAYRAKVETDAGTYDTMVSLRYSRAYLERMSWLYRQFEANKKQWRTVNCPFLYKLLDIVDKQGMVPRDAGIKRVEVELGELSEHMINDVILVWNLLEEKHKPSVEMMAAGKEQIYDHRIILPDTGAGYLAMPEGEDSFTTVFHGDMLSVRTEKEKHKSMKLIKAARLDREKDHTALLFPLQTNKRKMRHIDRQAIRQPGFLFTRGEVERILNSYEAFGDFELMDISMAPPGEPESLDCNPFIKTHSFLKQKTKIAVVLHAKDSADIFRYEKMFFLLSELQLYTDEYEWTGILR